MRRSTDVDASQLPQQWANPADPRYCRACLISPELPPHWIGARPLWPRSQEEIAHRAHTARSHDNAITSKLVCSLGDDCCSIICLDIAQAGHTSVN
jgi:hypothetical protein